MGSCFFKSIKLNVKDDDDLIRRLSTSNNNLAQVHKYAGWQV